MLFEKLSSNITDLPGVEGLCLMSGAGEMLFRKMPSFIPQTAYDEALRRITGLYETIDENFLPADDYILKFVGKWLILRRVGDFILLLLTTENTNLQSLRMVTNMTLKHLSATPLVIKELRDELAKESLQAEKAADKPMTVSGTPAAPSQVVAPTQATKSVEEIPSAPKRSLRMYRGQVVE